MKRTVEHKIVDSKLELLVFTEQEFEFPIYRQSMPNDVPIYEKFSLMEDGMVLWEKVFGHRRYEIAEVHSKWLRWDFFCNTLSIGDKESFENAKQFILEKCPNSVIKLPRMGYDWAYKLT